MPSEAFVDTSALLALLDSDEERHDVALEWLDTWDDRRLITSRHVIVECAALLDRRVATSASHAFLDVLLPMIDVLDIDARTFERGVAAYRSGRGRLRPSLVDSLTIEAMRGGGITTIFAFDQHFADAGFTVVPATPAAG